MSLELGTKRRFFKPIYTIGRFYVESQYFCDTLEPPVRELIDKNHDGDFMDPGEGKVYGNTAIPADRYPVKMYWWGKHQRWVPQICDVPGFTYILIHAVGTVKDTMACVGVGKNTKIGRLEDGPYYAAKITEIVQEAINNGEEVFITIQ
jgi:hypothetical protein